VPVFLANFMKLYFIHKDIFSNFFPNSITKTRILESTEEYRTLKLKEGEGPFTSIKQLRKRSIIFKDLAKQSSKKTNWILDPKHIVRIEDFILTNPRDSYSKDFIDLLEHTTKGLISQHEVFGVHFFVRKRMRIREIVKSPNSVGVWIARIDLFDSENNRWVSKKDQTSFFPENWTIHQLFHECHYAILNKVKDETRASFYLSKTLSGVNVEIIIKNDKLKSIYPIY
jgi:hypothetical protein